MKLLYANVAWFTNESMELLLIDNMLKRNSDFHSRSTRNASIMVCAKFKRETEGGKTFEVTISAKLWNSIPVDIRKMNSIKEMVHVRLLIKYKIVIKSHNNLPSLCGWQWQQLPEFFWQFFYSKLYKKMYSSSMRIINIFNIDKAWSYRIE